jgi:hypothetical protein
MKQLRWQILVVLITLGIVAVLLFSQQSPTITGPILPEPEQGGVYTEGLVGSLGRLNPLLDWNNLRTGRSTAYFNGLVRFDEQRFPRRSGGPGCRQDGTVYNFRSAECGLARWDPVCDDVLFTIDRMEWLFVPGTSETMGKIGVKSSAKRCSSSPA